MKLHVSSTISDIKSRYMCMDVNDVYLNNHMDSVEYIMVQKSMIPQELVNKYNLKETSNNGYIFARVTNWMYGLPQAGRIAHDALVQHL